MRKCSSDCKPTVDSIKGRLKLHLEGKVWNFITAFLLGFYVTIFTSSGGNADTASSYKPIETRSLRLLIQLESEFQPFLDKATLAAIRGDSIQTAAMWKKGIECAHKANVPSKQLLDLNLQAASALEDMMHPMFGFGRGIYARRQNNFDFQHLSERRKELILLTEPFYTDALTLAQKDGELKHYRVTLLGSLGEISHVQGDLNKEETLLKEAISEINSAKSPQDLVALQQAYVRLAGLSIRQEHLSQAEDLLKQSIDVCTVQQPAIFDQDLKLAELYLKLGKPELAVPIYAQTVSNDIAKETDTFWATDHLAQYERALRLSGCTKEQKLISRRLQKLKKDNPRFFKTGFDYTGPWRHWGHIIDDPADPQDDGHNLDI